MALRLYNTLTRRKDDFSPLDPERVRLYVCGPTVYDRAHIGNARPVIVFDVLFRLLRHLYGADHVVYARNITDIDDKIIDRAAERGITIRELTEGTARGFAEDVDALGCLRPTVEPRATDHIPEMIAVVERLVAGGHAYAPTEDGGAGHVLFAVGSMPDYGRLSNRTLDEMVAGARVEVAPYKRADGDFVLWKPSALHEPGWDSPWGRGRPGWHLECSAMSWKHLGETFDIHGGGLDLIFPHHENELAQSCCAFHRPVMAQVWMHNGFLQVEGQKMSKSLGNFVTIRDLLGTESFGGRRWPGEVLRLAMLRTHYRQPIDWTAKALEESERTLDRWYAAAEGVAPGEPAQGFLDELSDDLNTPGAIATLHGLMGESNTRGAGIASARLLGLLQAAPSDWAARREAEAGVDAAAVETLIAERLAARREKRWADSDRIRGELAALGVVLKDNKDGTTSWDVGRKGTA
ncbi:cysteine--tRNA ligase [Lichenibacterium dinghuense]|uniref:cysteine--tRNA ligase n=1 Tax=Lichenibacterium dinghuense TaxID=2895977 RepID=UPI001F004B21|nr:cysteine--tRNA ligase [Lichenibacterium sp. 6Y81]